jgi:hypothetical protein
MTEAKKPPPAPPAPKKEPLDPEEWVTQAEAAALAGVSQRVISKLASQGDIERKHDGTVFRFKVSDLDAVAGNAGRDHLVESLKLAHAHTENAFKLVFEPSRQVLELLKTENDALRTRVAELERTNMAAVRAREEALNEAHARKLAEKREDAKEARWESVFQTLKESSPLLLSQIGESVVAWSKSGKGSSAMKALEELDPAIIAGILDDKDTELSTESREALREILESRIATRGPRPDGETEH